MDGVKIASKKTVLSSLRASDMYLSVVLSDEWFMLAFAASTPPLLYAITACVFRREWYETLGVENPRRFASDCSLFLYVLGSRNWKRYSLG